MLGEVASGDGGDVFGGEARGGGDVQVIAEDAIGRINADPAGAGEVGFGPGVEGAFGGFAGAAGLAEVAAGEAGGGAGGAGGFGMEHGEIATGAVAGGERLGRSPGGALFAALVAEVLLQSGVQLQQAGDGV